MLFELLFLKKSKEIAIHMCNEYMQKDLGKYMEYKLNLWNINEQYKKGGAILNNSNTAMAKNYNNKSQKITVNNSYKFTVDHDEMMSSLLTLTNIEGLSSVDTNSKGNKEIVSRSINHICTIDKSKNYFDDAFVGTLHGDAITDRRNNDITVTSNTKFGSVEYNIPNFKNFDLFFFYCKIQ